MCKQYYTTLTCKATYIAKRYRSPHCENLVRLELAHLPCDLHCDEEDVERVDVTATATQTQNEPDGLVGYAVVQREVLVVWCQGCQRGNEVRKLSVIAETEEREGRVGAGNGDGGGR